MKTQCSLSIERVRVYNDERERKIRKDISKMFINLFSNTSNCGHFQDTTHIKRSQGNVDYRVRTNLSTQLLTNDIENSDIFDKYIRAVPDLKLMDDIEPQLKDRSQSNSVPVGPENNNSPEGFVYDFFVSHSHKDADWVLSRLVADLESAFTDDDVVLRGKICLKIQ